VHVFQAGNDKPLILGTKGGAKTAPLQAKFRGSSWWIFVVDFLGQVECIGKHPKGLHERGVFCWMIILIFNYQLCSK